MQYADVVFASYPLVSYCETTDHVHRFTRFLHVLGEVPELVETKKAGANAGRRNLHERYIYGRMIHMDIRLKIFEMRSYTPIPFLLMMVFFAAPTPDSLIAGFIVALIGEAIRSGASSLPEARRRTNRAVGATNLITDGPFGHVRNPLYVGNISDVYRLCRHVQCIPSVPRCCDAALVLIAVSSDRFP